MNLRSSQSFGRSEPACRSCCTLLYVPCGGSLKDTGTLKERKTWHLPYQSQTQDNTACPSSVLQFLTSLIDLILHPKQTLYIVKHSHKTLDLSKLKLTNLYLLGCFAHDSLLKLSTNRQHNQRKFHTQSLHCQ